MLLDLNDWEEDLGPHGHPMSEALSPLADPNNPDGQWVYDADLPYVDFAQRARDDAKDAFAKQYDGHPPNGLVWVVNKISRRADD